MSFLVVERFRLVKAKALLVCEMLEEAYLIYLGIIKRLAGKTCMEYGTALGGAGFALFQMGNCEEGKEYYYRAARVYEQLPHSGRRDLHLAVLYNDMGIVLKDELEYSQMLEYSDKALKLLGGLKPSVAVKHLSNIYNTRMTFCAENNDLEGFIESFPKAVAYREYFDRLTYRDMNQILERNLNSIMMESISQPDEILRLLNILLAMPELGSGMRNIVLESGSLFFGRVGDFDRALKYARQRLECSINTYGERSWQTAKAYIQAALCYYNITPDSKYWAEAGKSAFSCGYTALEILQDSFSENTEMIAEACYCLAVLLIRAEQYDDALRYIRQSIDKIRITRENEDFLVYSKITMFVEIYVEQGKISKALDYAVNALEAIKKDKNADCFQCLSYYERAIALSVVCKSDNAVVYARELMELWPLILKAIFEISQDDLRLSCVRLVKVTMSLLFSVEFTYRNVLCVEDLYEFALKINHIDTELNYIYVRHFQDLNNPELRTARQKVSKLEENIEWLAADGKGSTKEYEEINGQLEDARAEVLKVLNGSKADNTLEQLHLEDIQKTLEEKDVILEYGCYSRIKSEKKTEVDSEECYCGFIVTQNSVSLYFLGACEKIDMMINELIIGIQTGEDIGSLLEAIAEILLAPFKVHMVNPLNIYVVPDSLLYKLPFELLVNCIWPDENIMSRSVVYLSSGRNLLRNVRVPQKNKILILANPKYNLDEGSAGDSENAKISNDGFFDRKETVADPDVLPALRFSEAEAQRIAAVFGEGNAMVITGENAVINALQASPDADILHIATHGFAYQNRNKNSSIIDDIMQKNIYHFDKIENPLLRCGLYFAGASNWLRGEKLLDVYRNGVLFGHDLATMELSQYQLVVLSACQTAGGDAYTGEGIKGLRHAFELAGVGCLVCTLWEVDDLASALLMNRFYQELLMGKTFPAEALARAKYYVQTITAGELVQAGWDEYLNDDVIDSLLEEGQTDYAYYLQDILDIPDMRPFTHPRYWAGFIIQGSGTSFENI